MASSAKFAVPFRVAIQTSFLLNGALGLAYLGAFFWIGVFDIPYLIKLVIVTCILAGLVVHVRRHLFRTCKRAVVNLVWKAQGEWLLETSAGEIVTAKLLGSSFVTPWLIILNFKPKQGGRMWPVVIMPDNVDSTSFRRLSAKLKMYAGKEVSAVS